MSRVNWLGEYRHHKQVTYPNMMEFFESLGIDMELSDMSFSVSLDEGQGCEWGSRNGLSGLFAQKKNMLNPYFWKMLREIIKFKDDVLRWAILFSDILYNVHYDIKLVPHVFLVFWSWTLAVDIKLTRCFVNKDLGCAVAIPFN